MLKQAFKFFITSGIGWLSDMLIYSFLSTIIKIPVIVSNVISSFVAVTYVYLVSTKKIFKNNCNGMGIEKKYILYLFYQIIMIITFSFVINKVSLSLLNIDYYLIVRYSKICAKILVTPITMICNFIFMKLLIEKIK